MLDIALPLIDPHKIFARLLKIENCFNSNFQIPGILISPELDNVHWADFSQCKKLISLWESAALKELPEIKRISKTTVQRAFMCRIKTIIERLFAIRLPENE